MLRYRLISAIVLIPLILGSVILGGLAYFALIGAALLIGGYEFFEMARRAGYHPNRFLGLALIVLLVLDAMAAAEWTRPVLTAVLVVSLVASLFRHEEGWLVGWALTLAGALYLGVLGSYFFSMRALPDGKIWTGLVLLCAWATDTGAYVAGTSYGRHGFFTNISPKKTWEGAIGGWISATLSMAVLSWIAGLPFPHGLALGFGVGLAGTVGDLAESVIKRQMGAKDSGALVPGHGGLLDRMDSLLFAAVFAYYYLVWIARI